RLADRLAPPDHPERMVDPHTHRDGLLSTPQTGIGGIERERSRPPAWHSRWHRLSSHCGQRGQLKLRHHRPIVGRVARGLQESLFTVFLPELYNTFTAPL